MLSDYPNVMLLSGTGRNVGKTTFVCRLLSHFSSLDIITVKVSPHWHQTRQGEVLLLDEERLLLMRETNSESYKDTSRMLRCGAAKVFYLQHRDDDALLEAFHYLMEKEVAGNPVVFETAVLGKYINAALHFRITRSDVPPSDKPRIDIPHDKLVTFNGTDYDLDPGHLNWKNSGWQMSN